MIRSYTFLILGSGNRLVFWEGRAHSIDQGQSYHQVQMAHWLFDECLKEEFSRKWWWSSTRKKRALLEARLNSIVRNNEW